MATYRILCWHDIPIRVKARDANGDTIEHLPERFQMAADSVATNIELTQTKAYLAGWRYSDPNGHAGSAGDVEKTVAAELVEAFPPKRVAALCREFGSETEGD